MKKKITIITCAGLLAASSWCLADTVAEDIDLDKDGFISVEEAEAVPELQEQFATLDVNKDGKIDMEELSLLAEK